MVRKSAEIKATKPKAPKLPEGMRADHWISALEEVSKKLISSNGNNGLRSRVPRLVAEGMKLPFLTVLTLGKDQKRFVPSIGWGEDEYSHEALEFPVFSRLAEWITKSKDEIIIASDLSKESEAWIRGVVKQIGLRSLIGIKLGTQVVIGMGEEPRTFSREEVVAFGCLSRLAGLAVEKIRREEEIRSFAGEIHTHEIIEKVIETLNEISAVVSSALELDELLAKIVRVIVNVTGGDTCLLYLYDEDKDELRLRASNTTEPEVMEKIKMKLGEGITGWVARERKVVAIAANASGDPRFKFFNELPEDRYQAFLSVPMVNHGKFIGVVNVQHKEVYPHSDYEIALFSAIAQQVGGVIENARLHELLETRKLVDRAKGILMKEKGITEPEAFRLIQKEAMNTRRSMREIAQAIVITANIRGI